MEHKRRINVRAIIFRDGQLLAVIHKSTTSGNTFYFTPGGGLDPHESLADGLTREILEETGVKAQVGRLLFIQQFASEREGYSEELELFFEVSNVNDFDSIDLEQTTHGNEELSVCEFVDPSSVVILPKFLQSIDIASYIETPQPPLIIDNFNE